MEKFGYKMAWKRHKFMACGYPVIGLLSVSAYWVVLVLPGDATFEWWVPLLVVALIAWAIFEIVKFKKSLGYSVKLTEDSIQVADEQAHWEDVSRIELKNGFGNDPAIILHTKDGKALAVAAATESLPYVKGFIEGHVKNALCS